MNTRKKVKILGEQNYINPDTNELLTMQVMSIEERDANFYKLWLSHIIQSMDIIGNRKSRFAFWLLDQMDSENKICMTQRQMAKKMNISLDTVRKTIIALLKSDFLTKHNTGVYKVNPDVIFKGGKTDRLNVLIQYRTTQAEQKADERKRKEKDDIVDEEKFGEDQE
jgi:DNA-binding transcriptional regulator YhcF (GntR family)